MTTRCRRLLVFGLLAGLLAVGVSTWLLWPRTEITRENAAKIQKGMTLAEIGEILGGPPRDEATGPAVPIPDEHLPVADRQAMLTKVLMLLQPVHAADEVPPQVLTWQSNRIMVLVQFDAEDRVSECNSFPVRIVQESPLDRLRRWLRL